MSGGASPLVPCACSYTISPLTVCIVLPFASNVAYRACFVPDHFHVHIVNANYVGLPGMSAGQAHLLDDVISLVGTCFRRRWIQLMLAFAARMQSG